MKILVGLLLVANVGTAHAQGPQLPPPAEKPAEVEALMQKARALYQARNYRESAASWQTVAAREPAVASFAQRESVRALIAAGDLEPALTAIAVLGATAPAELLLRAADACRAGGTLDRAATLYRRAREAAGRTTVADEAALGLARTLEADNKPLEALQTYRELQLTFREVGAFDTADAGARRLSKQLDGAEPLTEADYEAIVDRLESVAAFRRAVDMQIEWLAGFPATARRAHVEVATVQNLYALRANDDARARASAFLKNHSTHAEAHTVVITLFRLDVREGKTADVEKRGRAIFGGHVRNTTLADRMGAGRLLAEYLVSVGQPVKAHGVYAALLKLAKTRGARADVLWRMAIASLRAENRPRAIKELQQVLALKPDSETERAALFWLAYAHHAGGDVDAAKQQWSALVERFPFSYYGLRAAARIAQPLPGPSLRFPDLTLTAAVEAHPDYRAAAVLSRAGLLADAAEYARRLNGAFRRSDAVALLAARASEAAGDHAAASALMSSYFGPYLERPAEGLPDDFWELAYPRAYWPEVYSAASKHSVDPLLMMGLARQESHFDRAARSPVGAVGLFQIMWYTAAELDPLYSSPSALERLVQPEVSAELAAKLLAGLHTLYRGATAPTVASYNADKERVQVWWSSAKGLPEELFIDSIPYRETRAYVRQVLANYAMYQRSALSTSPRK